MGLAPESSQAAAGAANSAIDLLFSVARRSSELTSVALVSIEELIRGTGLHPAPGPQSLLGRVEAMSVRDLVTGATYRRVEVMLRPVLTGWKGSVNTIRAALDSLL